VARTHVRQILAGLILAGTAAGGASCSTAPPTSPGPSSTEAPPAAASPPTPTQASASSAPARVDPVQEGPTPAPPRPTAGPLTVRNLPSAGSIGPSFRPYVEPDVPQESFVTNGTLVHERDPQEVAASIGPLGCPGLDRLDPLPVPRHALEQTYRTPDHLAAVALALDYDSERQAVLMIRTLTGRLDRCTTPPSADALTTARVVVDLRRHDAATLLDTRYEVGPDATRTHWDETVVRKGRRVALVIIERAPGAPISSQDQLAVDLRQRLARP
jgi:hypothetical protein